MTQSVSLLYIFLKFLFGASKGLEGKQQLQLTLGEISKVLWVAATKKARGKLAASRVNPSPSFTCYNQVALRARLEDRSGNGPKRDTEIISGLILIVSTTMVYIKIVEQVSLFQQQPITFSISPLKLYFPPYSDLGFRHFAIQFGV